MMLAKKEKLEEKVLRKFAEESQRFYMVCFIGKGKVPIMRYRVHFG